MSSTMNSVASLFTLTSSFSTSFTLPTVFMKF
jgi:hypothetical protein